MESIEVSCTGIKRKLKVSCLGLLISSSEPPRQDIFTHGPEISKERVEIFGKKIPSFCLLCCLMSQYVM